MTENQLAPLGALFETSLLKESQRRGLHLGRVKAATGGGKCLRR